MRSAMSLVAVAAICLAGVALAGCGSTGGTSSGGSGGGSGSGGSGSSSSTAYTIGGTVSGLSGTGLVLQDDDADNLAVQSNGAFAFDLMINSGKPYSVTVLAQPSNPSQNCAVANGSGTATADISNVQVTCSIVTPVAAGSWVWMGGAKVTNQSGTYGTLGVPSASNFPGARESSATWTDSTGGFWLFGGTGFGSGGTSGHLSDLWRYSGGEWTWVAGPDTPDGKGVYGAEGTAAADNYPGARFQAVTWTDPQGNFWLFGGAGWASGGSGGNLNDLWKYSPATRMWTWVSGSDVGAQPGTSGAWQGTGIYGTKGVAAPTNSPGARVDAVSWVDSSGNLWLFGGEGTDGNGTLGILNDLWKFSPSTGMWTWMSGSDTRSQSGVYGTQGVASPSNVPGARTSGVTWTDNEGNLWLFGGQGLGGNGCQGALECVLNDLWKYSPATGMWTWEGGADVVEQQGKYGTRGVASSSNIPGARWFATGWADSQGNFWLFGGNGVDASDRVGDLNDLWEYSPASGKWMWVNGSNQAGQLGDYGTVGVAAASDVPGARLGAVGWRDSSGNLWLFGGDDSFDLGLALGGGKFNDLWEYQP